MNQPKDPMESTRNESGSALGLEAVLAVNPDVGSAQSVLTAKEQTLVALVDGKLPVSELLLLSGLSSFVAMFMLRALVQRGVLQLVVPGPALESAAEPVTEPNDTNAAVLAAGPPSELRLAPLTELKSGPLAAATPAGFRVGPYDVATRIGQGGMGSIYLCRRLGASGFRRLYILKVVRQHAIQEDLAVRSFMREARIGMLMDHPNALTVVDVGTYNEQPFLVLGYVEGANLSELLGEGQPIPAALVVPVILDTLRALQKAHDLVDDQRRAVGLVHCDVSPQNIMVGIDGVTRLTDFGSARFTGGPDPDATASIMGKPAYMAPEQLCGEPIDVRTDIFSVGVVMWTALTGQKLFADPSYEKTVMNVMRKKVPPPSSFGAPACLDEICLAALDRSREGRYQTADAMARALLTAAAAEGLVAGSREVGGWVWRAVGETLAERRRRVDQLPPTTEAPLETSAPRSSVPAPTQIMMRAMTPPPPRSPPELRRTWLVAGGAAAAAIAITLIGVRLFMVPARSSARRERARSTYAERDDAVGGRGQVAPPADIPSPSPSPSPPPPPAEFPAFIPAAPPPGPSVPRQARSPGTSPPVPATPPPASAPVRRTRRITSAAEAPDTSVSQPQDASTP